MIEPHADRAQVITLSADKAYHAEHFVNELRSMRDAPCRPEHQPQTFRDRRAHNAASRYALSQRIRKRIEEAFRWIKTVAGQQKTKFRGIDRVRCVFNFAAAAYDFVRLPKLLAEAD